MLKNRLQMWEGELIVPEQNFASEKKKLLMCKQTDTLISQPT